ncbi:MAG: FAD-binding oxidoreductase [Armatimonadetes bacterium]|nr:FAD-binding oxidoreductase [Armatimonadota bacterium]CUU34801.1 glycolate oxidase FAD binding subunit [Armatimonadetes bacterium DC]
MIEGLHAIVGSEGVLACEPAYCLGRRTPATVVAPQSEEEVAALVKYAAKARFPFVIGGGGTALSMLEPPAEAWWLLSTRRLKGVVDYAPEDLVLTVRAGTTLAEAQQLLSQHRQYLPWNVPLPEQATIGGIVSGNRSGSWRYRHGTPRDRLLQVRAVRGDGVAFRSGAKVVKSVAGYDIHRLLCGAWGTLSVLTEITLKVAPLPPVFEVVGWFSTWDVLEPTLAHLMGAPLQPDGMTVLAFAGESLTAYGAVAHESQAIAPSGTGITPRASLIQASATGVLTPPPPVVYEEATQTFPEPETEAALQTEPATSRPFVLIEFSGRPEGVRWQIEWLRSQGYPAEPVEPAMLKSLQNALAPRTHRFMLQLLMRPNEVAEAMVQWSRPGVSMLAHAGSGVLYLWGESVEPIPFLTERLRHTAFRWRVLNWAEDARADLPPIPLSEGERRLMQALKQAFDPAGVLPRIV